MRTKDKGHRTEARTLDGGTKAGEKPVFAFVLCLLSFVLPAVAAPKFAVTPYLQRPAADAMTVIFFTDSVCTATVTCGNMTTNTVGVWAEALTNNVNCGESSVWNNSLYKHSVRLTGLEANRSYEYTVTLAGGVSYSNTFRTAPSRNTPIRFVSYADCETEKSPWSNYVKNLKRMKDRQPDFFALSGDYAARGGRQEHWDGFWKANAGTETDVAGSIPILAVIGNHDLFDQGLKNHTSGYWYDMQGEPSTDRYVTYFGSELYYREDYGPVTLIFLDTNNGRDGDTDDDHDHDTNYLDREDGQHLQGGLDRRKGCRHPDFNVGTPQYDWLTNNLADAQAKSRFTFVFNHHCPYSRGAHNMDWREHEDGSALALRFLTETFVRYGVDGWYCGHDELLEHSITNGWEILPNGQRRKHTLSIYDLGCSGDKPRDSDKCTNPLEYWWNEDNYGGASGTKYGFLETDVTTNRNGQWTCTITPVQGSSGNYLNAQIVYVENPDRGEDENDLVYAEAANASHPIDGASQTKPSDWLPWTKPPEGPDPEPTPHWVETPVFVKATRITLRADVSDETQYTGFLTKKGLEYAWGKDGKAATEWKQSDGTPMELEKPDAEDGWELMVRESPSEVCGHRDRFLRKMVAFFARNKTHLLPIFDKMCLTFACSRHKGADCKCIRAGKKEERT